MTDHIVPSHQSDRNKTLLMMISCLAYATIGFHFSIRSMIAGDLETLFATIDAAHAAQMVGSVLGIAFLGYGITILVISPLMFVMRHFAGPLAHKFSPVGLLWMSCLLSSIGLWWLSVAGTPVTAFMAATFWGTGVCFMWPTMLATVNDRYPRAGALGLGLVGFGAMLAIYKFMPIMGKVYDKAKVKTAGGIDAFNALKGEELDAVLATASQESFRIVAVLPVILLVVFGCIWIYDKVKGVHIEVLDTQVRGPSDAG